MTHGLLQVHDPVVGHPSIITQSRTQWHSMHEAKMTIHHLGPGEFRRRVHCQPMEAVRPQRVTEQSGVVGSWSLEEKVKMSKPKKKKISKNNDDITARPSHHKHVSCGHVFVHHKPGVLLSTNPGPLTQSHGEPTCGDTTDDVTPAGSEELCMFFFSLLLSLHFNTLIINPRLAGQTRPTQPSNLAGNWITNGIKRSNFILLCHTQGINQSKQINTKTL